MNYRERLARALARNDLYARSPIGVAPPTYEELVRAEYEHNKEIAEHIGKHMTVVVGDLTSLAHPHHRMRGDLEGE